MPIIKSDNDPKSYRYFTLGNGLNILLIHDAQIEPNATNPPIESGEEVHIISH